MHGIWTNYCYLNNPFPDEEETDVIDIQLTSVEQIFAAFTNTPLGGDKPKSFEEASRSPEWLEWEHTVQTELAQLQETGTWRLVDKPADAILISNKWVLMEKYNKAGNLLKYKGRLVVKSYMQHPGHNYVETFSPAVWLETIWGIIELAAIKHLKIQQRDVKGVYLNGILKKKVYMCQPEGFDNGTSWVCLLIKTIYGLQGVKQQINKEGLSTPILGSMCIHSEKWW